MGKTIEDMLNIHRQVEGIRVSLEELSSLEPPRRGAPVDKSPRLALPAVLEATNGQAPVQLQVCVVQGGYQASEGRLILIIDVEEPKTTTPNLKDGLPARVDVLLDAEPLRTLKANIPLTGLREQFLEIELPEDVRSIDCWQQFDDKTIGEVPLPLRFLVHR